MEAYDQSFDVSNATNKETLMSPKHAEKIEQVRDVLVKVEQDSLKSLELVDAIQRLGLSHHFKDEIEVILHHQYLANDCDSLLEASLRFRLLRQHGYEVVTDDFFGQFLHREEDSKVRLRGGLVGGTRGVMAMHEASHLNMGGEEILHEAAVFSSQYLNNKALICVEDDEEEAKMAMHCLNYPQHKSLAGFTAKNYLQFLNGEENHLLRELAELEFASMESLHKYEILRVVEWWKGLRLSNEVKSWRNEPVKWHMWSMATLTDPNWSKHRILLTKAISLVYVVDDIFDLHGTIHHLTLFTQAVNRWDICAVDDELPSYMKTCFNVIYDTTNEISNVVCREHGCNPIEFLKKEWGSLMDAFLVEAKWLRSGELVKADEYLKNGVVSSGVPMVLSHLFFLMGNPLTNQTLILLHDPHGLTHSIAKLLRLLDDFNSAQDEQQEGYDGSYVECYMKEGKVDSLEAAREHVIGMVSETWENINKHGLSSTSTSSFSACFRSACLNTARMVPTMYTYDENHRLPLLRRYIESMFHDPTFAESVLG